MEIPSQALIRIPAEVHMDIPSEALLEVPSEAFVDLLPRALLEISPAAREKMMDRMFTDDRIKRCQVRGRTSGAVELGAGARA